MNKSLFDDLAVRHYRQKKHLIHRMLQFHLDMHLIVHLVLSHGNRIVLIASYEGVCKHLVHSIAVRNSTS